MTEAELTIREFIASMPAAYAQLLAMAYLLIATGQQARVTDTVLRLTGRAPRSFVDFVRGARPHR